MKEETLREQQQNRELDANYERGLAIEGKTFIRTKDGIAGCIEHNGEHPFHYKETVNAYVTYCHEVLLATERNREILFHP